ncbi:MAG: bacillithiol biosynthesis cysteine-adding enzyme BshC [Gemmatimonadaceae bacterium]
MSLRIISTPLQGKNLTSAALTGSVPAWYAAHPHGSAEWRSRAKTITSQLTSKDWLTPLLPALEPTDRAEERLRAAASGGGFVVTAGQQPALFGGPLYTWWKALSAVAFADALEKETGLPVAPVYWAATDDSDFVEAASTVVTTPEGAQRISLDHLDDPGLPMSLVELGDVSRQLEALRAAAGSASHPAILEVVERAYASGETIGSSFIKLLRNLLSPLGVAVLDASHTSVRAQARPVMERALERAQAIEAALVERDKELKKAGYSSQVQTVRGRSLVFSSTDGRRARVPLTHSNSTTDKSMELSPNVLLRPIVELSILPTVAYLGGPAEIAYFAQVNAVAAALETEAPLILPRWSGIVIEPRIQKILDKHKLTPADFKDPQAIETRTAMESLPEDLRSTLEEIRRVVEQEIAKLTTADPDNMVSGKVIDGLTRNILHRIERLERRYRAAIKRRGNEALRDIATARAALYPVAVPQERALNVVPLLARYGDSLFESVMTEVIPHAASLV